MGDKLKPHELLNIIYSIYHVTPVAAVGVLENWRRQGVFDEENLQTIEGDDRLKAMYLKALQTAGEELEPEGKKFLLDHLDLID